jgi:hypothetical protein
VTYDDSDLIVRLERWEYHLAVLEAQRRHEDALFKDQQDRAGNDERTIDKDLVGTAAEYAFARWVGRYWTGGKPGAGDVGSIEVRGRRGRPDHLDTTPCLILQPYDEQHRPNTPFVLVVGGGITWRIVGYMTPAKARELVTAQTHGARVGDPGNRGRPALLIDQVLLTPPDQMKAPESPV